MRRDKTPSDGGDVSKSLAIGFRNIESLITSKANETRDCMKSELEKVDNRMAQWEIKNANLEEYVMKLSNSFNELQARTSGPTPSTTKEAEISRARVPAVRQKPPPRNRVPAV